MVSFHFALLLGKHVLPNFFLGVAIHSAVPVLNYKSKDERHVGQAMSCHECLSERKTIEEQDSYGDAHQ